MARMFSFDPRDYAATFRSEGFVHIPGGLSEEFYQILSRQVDEYLAGELMKDFAIGDKQQALYQFPPNGNYQEDLRQAVAGVCGVEASALVLSERHIKAYEAKAIPDPLAHKDRFASEFSVGFSVRVANESTLSLFPYDELDVNPFNSSTELRASLRPAWLPEKPLQNARRVDIKDSPGDVIMFRGNSIWHLRSRPAGTVMLYLKLNTFNCDPLGEDAATADFRKRTNELLTHSDAELEPMIPLLGRRVDYFHRRYNRDWQEVIGVVLWGERHFTIDAEELRALQAVDGKRSVREMIEAMGPGGAWQERMEKVRALAARGILDLLPARVNSHRSNGTLQEDRLLVSV
ncbi:MAG: hypothetical protein HYX68_05670 [Planctomycetes bacterium]|nr:hypothetical protein [Planctomycetota bacterium]